MRIPLLCLSLLLCLPLQAQVYTYIDAEGNRVFTDQPRSSNAQQVQLAPTNAMQQPSAAPLPAPPPAMEAAPPAYELLRILVPEPDASIRDNAGTLIVTASSEPPLLAEHAYRLLLDGQPVGAPGRSPVFALENIDRGTHQLAVEIIDAQGRTLERTPSQPFHMLRTSLAQRRMVHPCQKDDYGVRPECPLKDKPAEKRDIPLIPFL